MEAIKKEKTIETKTDTEINVKEYLIENLKEVTITIGKKKQKLFEKKEFSNTKWVIYKKLYTKKGFYQYATLGLYSEDVDLENDHVEKHDITEDNRSFTLEANNGEYSCIFRLFIKEFSGKEADIKVLHNNNNKITAVFVRIAADIDDMKDFLEEIK